MTRISKTRDKCISIGELYPYVFNYNNSLSNFQHILKYKQLHLYHQQRLVTTTATDIAGISTTGIQLVCYHQCRTCGIIYDCVETRQKCKLPFSDFRTKCFVCGRGRS